MHFESYDEPQMLKKNCEVKTTAKVSLIKIITRLGGSATRWLSEGQSLSESCLCVECLPLCISIGITTVHSGAISIATVLHSATELY